MTVYSVDVEVRAPVQATEVPDRVARAVEELFPNADVDVGSEEVVASTHDLEAFRECLFEQRILDTARSAFLDGRTDSGFAFDLKKQAAFRGVVNFSVGKPAELGDIHVAVTVREPDVEEFITYLAPETEDGDPVEL
ncbi:coaE operon protein [Halarchaeum sp. CBA1220]|uniref:RNA-binding domain-containing protein n=1 Tax=Halarchaeum sp. CBA1220 TaxID=1853682 RepID=UPI000F3A8DB7|nr:RNA-binding domain-containing protein [Halarchaeum sp. CBA1220]QLC33425.1 coaE operon protein [Halarchaeum sp. CBA1220]